MFATVLVSLTAGYCLGRVGLFSISNSATKSTPRSSIEGFEQSQDTHKRTTELCGTSAIGDTNATAIANTIANEEHKMILVVRTDLGMTKGKIVRLPNSFMLR